MIDPSALPHPESPTDPASSCPSCAIARTSGARFCPQCGVCLAVLSSPAAAERSTVAPEPASGVAAEAPADSPQAALHAVSRGLPATMGCCPSCGAARNGESVPDTWLRRVGSSDSDAGVPLVDEQLIIGKDPECGVVVADDEYVSRRHARLRREDGLVFLDDLGSSNGTLLKICRPVIIEPGDEILIGSTVLRLEKRSGGPAADGE